MPFKFTKLDIPDVILIEPAKFEDDRGFFIETYKSSDFISAGINADFQQDNHSYSKKNVIRGLHLQSDPSAQAKLIRVVHGRVWDVAVDLRIKSPSYLKWVGIDITSGNNQILYIPEGFAHGFATLSDNVHLIYKCSREYAPDCDSGVRWDDPDINIKWPLSDPIISDKDKKLPFINEVVEVKKG